MPLITDIELARKLNFDLAVLIIMRNRKRSSIPYSSKSVACIWCRAEYGVPLTELEFVKKFYNDFDAIIRDMKKIIDYQEDKIKYYQDPLFYRLRGFKKTDDLLSLQDIILRKQEQEESA